MSNQQLAPWQGAIAQAERKFNEIATAEGNLVTYQKEAMFAMQAIQSNDYLQGVPPQSIQNAVINVASIGISLNPALSFAYLVPRDGKCCLDISYKGLVKLATDTGSIQWAKAELVRKNDEFDLISMDQVPVHKFNPFATEADRGEVIGGYCVAKLADGSFMIETMSREEMDKVKDSSKAKSAKSPWNTWYGEMAKKTIIKRASKSWPKTSPRLAEAIQVVNEHEGLDLSSEAAHAEKAEPECLPEYDEESFNERFKNYEEWIRSGTRTKEEIINTLTTRFTLSEDQLNKINSVETIDANS